jgi:hypothetical protein
MSRLLILNSLITPAFDEAVIRVRRVSVEEALEEIASARRNGIEPDSYIAHESTARFLGVLPGGGYALVRPGDRAIIARIRSGMRPRGTEVSDVSADVLELWIADYDVPA